MDNTKYFILDSADQPVEVSEEEQRVWIENNAARYELNKTFASNTKNAQLNFVGIKYAGGKRIIFEVETKMWTADGEYIPSASFNQEFTSYKKALAAYQEYLFFNGGNDKDNS